MRRADRKGKNMMKRLTVILLAVALTLTVGSAGGASSEIDLRNMRFTFPTNSLFGDFDQEGAAGTVTPADPPVSASGEEVPVITEGFVPDRLNKVVIGEDDRIQVFDTAEYPFSAIANMKVTGECGENWECTGFMVGKNFLLTAAHCMYCPEHQKWAQNVTFYFGYKSNSNCLMKYTGGWNAVVGTTFPEGYDFSGMSDDWCYVKLEKNVGEETGWLSFRCAADSEINEQGYVVAGYRNNRLKYCYGEATVSDDHLILFDADDQPGNSGGPIFFTGAEGEKACADAIIAAECTEPLINIGRRISRYMYDCMVRDGYQ